MVGRIICSFALGVGIGIGYSVGKKLLKTEK